MVTHTSSVRALAALLLVLVLTGVAVRTSLSTTWFVAIGLVALIAGLSLWIIREDSTTASSRDSAVWDAIPSWQYSGRHIESGGLTRDEQEKTIKEIEQEAQERAAEEAIREDLD